MKFLIFSFDHTQSQDLANEENAAPIGLTGFNRSIW